MTAQCKIKICGITNREDLLLAAEAGADFGGVLVEIGASARSRTREEAGALFGQRPLPMVAVTLNQSEETNREIAQALSPHALQLHGQETVETVRELKQSLRCEIWKVIHLPSAESGERVGMEDLLATMRAYAEAGVDRFLTDTSAVLRGERHYGGTGMTVDWQAARRLRDLSPRPLVLAGGLQPENVSEAVRVVEPYAVDVSSGVEASKGKKDPQKVRRLIQNIRNACP